MQKSVFLSSDFRTLLHLEPNVPHLNRSSILNIKMPNKLIQKLEDMKKEEDKKKKKKKSKSPFNVGKEKRLSYYSGWKK